MKKTIYILIIALVAFLCLHSCSVYIDPKIANTAFGLTAIKYEYIIMIISLCSGILCIIGGFILTILGFAGSIDWIIEGTDFTSKLMNASPGVLLMIIGFLIIILKRMDIRSKKTD